MKSWLKTALTLCTMLSATFVCGVCFAQNYVPDNAPNPQNWQNSGDNYNSANGIYDRSGNRTGYSVPTENGGINYFNSDGSRRGYQPGH